MGVIKGDTRSLDYSSNVFAGCCRILHSFVPPVGRGRLSPL